MPIVRHIISTHPPFPRAFAAGERRAEEEQRRGAGGGAGGGGAELSPVESFSTQTSVVATVVELHRERCRWIHSLPSRCSAVSRAGVGARAGEGGGQGGPLYLTAIRDEACEWILFPFPHFLLLSKFSCTFSLSSPCPLRAPPPSSACPTVSVASQAERGFFSSSGPNHSKRRGSSLRRPSALNRRWYTSSFAYRTGQRRSLSLSVQCGYCCRPRGCTQSRAFRREIARSIPRLLSKRARYRAR